MISLLIFSPLLLTAAGEKSSVVGWVTQCNGDWEDRTDAQHRVMVACKGSRGELWFPLSRESQLFLASHRSRQWINVRIARTGKKHHFDCDKPGECDPPPLPFVGFVPREQSVGVLQAFFRSPGNSYSRVRLLLSKSENDESPRVTVDHAVVADGAPTSLRDLFRPATPPGDYLMELCPFDEKNGCPSGSKPLSVNWSRDTNSVWPNSVSAGLYEVVLSKVVNSVTMRTPDRGLLLVVSKQNIAMVREEVQAGEQIFLRDWKDPSEGRLMFQALLVDLAPQPGK